MKVISIMQPWATLVAMGEKRFETRSWRTKYRGKLAIHASLKIEKAVCRYEPFQSVLEKHGYTERTLPSGVILAIGKLADCFQVIGNKGDSAKLDEGQVIEGREYSFGNFSEGRYAWEVTDVHALDTPIPAKGKLGLWEHEFTD
jgi:hypothetical protein